MPLVHVVVHSLKRITKSACINFAIVKTNQHWQSVRQHSVYSLVNDPSDVMKSGPTRKKKDFLLFFSSNTSKKTVVGIHWPKNILSVA